MAVNVRNVVFITRTLISISVRIVALICSWTNKHTTAGVSYNNKKNTDSIPVPGITQNCLPADLLKGDGNDLK